MSNRNYPMGSENLWLETCAEIEKISVLCERREVNRIMTMRKLSANQKNVSRRQYLRKINNEIQKLNLRLLELNEVKELLDV